jgi:hypothetical protein
MYVGDFSFINLGSCISKLLVWMHSSMSDFPNVLMSTLPQESAGLAKPDLDARSKYLRPLIISFASDEMLNARMDCIRPKSVF